MYDDYAIDETLFHWQSQGRTADNSATGMSYIKQVELNKKILLFVRESKNDMYGNTAGYVFVGLGNFMNYEGSETNVYHLEAGRTDSRIFMDSFG